MFASLTTLLPSTFQQNTVSKPSKFVPDDDEDDDKNPTDVDEHGVVKKKESKKDKSPSETFIFVRPPPSKTNHPLNLQVQLVPPHSRAPAGIQPELRTSIDSTANGAGQTPELSRVASNRSETSYSGYASTASFSSVTSSASTASGRRNIIPLYSLQAHNVMTNVIVDAGTDAKIAKFSKRGIEMIDLAIIEPTEVWVANPNARAGSLVVGNGNHLRASTDVTGLGISHEDLPHQPQFLLPMTNAGDGRSSMVSSRPVTPEGTHTPGSSRLSVSSAGLEGQQVMSVNSHATSPGQGFSGATAKIQQPTATTPSAKRNIFGKLFKKKDVVVPPSSSATPTGTPRSPAVSHVRSTSVVSQSNVETTPTPSNPKRHSIISVSSPAKMEFSDTQSTVTVPATSSVGRQPVLGIQPTISCTIYPPPPGSRPSMYAWHVRRWLKGGDNGLLSGVMGKLSINEKAASVSGFDRVGASTFVSGVEVRFEWKRGKPKNKKRKGKVPGGTPDSNDASRRGSLLVGATAIDHHRSQTSLVFPSEEVSNERKRANRLSALSHHSVSTTHDDKTSGAGDDGNESDPEDSETPWTCTLKVRRAGAAGATSAKRPGTARARESNSPDQQVLRIKVGTLSPTPHHPKVVAMLKVPFPLPDVLLEKIVSKKREIGPTGSLAKRSALEDDDAGLRLTAEEIKDVVCSTGLWLVVREGFGGVGKVNRKGDGWRIRG